MKVQSHAFLTSAQEGADWSASCLSRFTFRETDPDTNWTGECVGPRAGLNAVEKEKFPAPSENRTPGPRSSSP